MSLLRKNYNFLGPLATFGIVSISCTQQRCWSISVAKSNGKSQQSLDDHKKAMMAKGIPKRRKIEGVKKVIAVASGKGGVGKSTIATNLAVALKQSDPSALVSLLDADVFGPSIPRMMNVNESPALDENNKMIPLQNHGIKCMSMGFLVKEGAPIIWRGLMVMQAIEKLVRGVKWSETDTLIIDMPPGTGDTLLSFAQTVVIDGAIIVTTPQKVAVDDAVRGAEMFRKMGVPLLGCILNMSSFVCQNCGSTSKIPGFLDQLAPSGLEIIVDIPFNIDIMASSDEGCPIVLKHPNSSQAVAFHKVAIEIKKRLEDSDKKVDC